MLALAAVSLTAGVTAMAAIDGRPSGEELLNETRERYAHAESVAGTAVVTVDDGSATAGATVEFAATDDAYRIAVARNGTTYRAGSNGTVAWYVGPNGSGAWSVDALRERGSVPAGSEPLELGDGEALAFGEYAAGEGDAPAPRATLNRTSRALNRTTENVSVEVLRTGSDDGIEAYVVRIASENESLDGRATLWIAKDDARLLRAEATDGANATVVDYRDTRFNVSVHESTFDPPADRLTVTGVDRYGTFDAVAAETDFALPTLNATFLEAGVTTRTAGVVVAQRYRTGGENVTVVSTTIDRGFDRSGGDASAVTVDGHEAIVRTVGDSAAVYWRSDGVTTAVVAESEERAVELARRLAE